MDKDLVRKYNVPGPRYTSYPTVPYWEDVAPTQVQWMDHVSSAFKISEAKGEGISLYLHLPFCEKLCTYCGCNKRITINHNVEDPYITTLLQVAPPGAFWKSTPDPRDPSWWGNTYFLLSFKSKEDDGRFISGK